MEIRRAFVATVALCLVSLNLGGTLYAQDLVELAAITKARRAADAAAADARHAAVLAADVARQAAFDATPEGKRLAAIEKTRLENAAKVAAIRKTRLETAAKVEAAKVTAEKLAAEKSLAALKASGRLKTVGEKATEKTNAAAGNDQREALIKAQFSLWDGSHTKLTEAIKAKMNDPSSYKHVNTTYIDPPGDRLVITTTFRGKNAFGAVVTNTVMGVVDMSGNVLDMRDR